VFVEECLSKKWLAVPRKLSVGLLAALEILSVAAADVGIDPYELQQNYLVCLYESQPRVRCSRPL
jgi:hypothetical protein